jgi:feruloyl esterase
VFFPWIAQANTDKAGRQVVGADKLQLLHTEVLAACDALDGLTDGLFTDPRTCAFDPYRKTCHWAGTKLVCDQETATGDG